MCDLVGMNLENEISSVISFDNERCGGCGTICFTESCNGMEITRRKKSTIWLVLRERRKKKGGHNHNPNIESHAYWRFLRHQRPLSNKNLILKAGFLSTAFHDPPLHFACGSCAERQRKQPSKNKTRHDYLRNGIPATRRLERYLHPPPQLPASQRTSRCWNTVPAVSQADQEPWSS